MGIRCDDCGKFSNNVTEFKDGQIICVDCESKWYDAAEEKGMGEQD